MKEDLKAQDAVQESNAPKLPRWFWVVSIAALLWFLMDVSSFVMRVFMLDSMINGMAEDQRTLYLTMPAWVNVVFALEVYGGFFGSLFLVLKKKRALIFFITSIVGVLAQTVYVYFLSDAISIMGVQAAIMPMVAIIIGAGLIFFTKLATARKWIN